MKVNIALVKTLDLSAATDSVIKRPLDHLPLLIGDRCFDSPGGGLTKWTASNFAAGRHIEAETISMPRRGFGPRPVTLIAAADRVLYSALVGLLQPSLPPLTRAPGNWDEFSKFGLPGTANTALYIVTIDIAACYEYIDHELLRSELLLHTFEIETVSAVISLLGEMFGRPRGLPQMTGASDALADTYLSAIERALLRQGLAVRRYADDFRVLAPDWATANSVIETAADTARRYGLVLSSEKTNIALASTLKERADDVDQFIEKYFQAAQNEVVDFEIILGRYDEFEEMEVHPSTSEALEAALQQILNDWKDSPPDSTTIHGQLVGRALKSLETADFRLEDELITQITFRQPFRLDAVVRYLLARSETRENWTTLEKLVEMPRQSPWAKVWLLYAAESLTGDGATAEAAVAAWAVAQTTDKHEVVRAEAAWYLAKSASLNEQDYSTLYSAASSISRPAIAAALARSGAAATSSISRALIGDSKLSAQAFAWGAAQ